jgi:hypothetical protein
MKIFPAIDIKDKKCVRLIKGDFENKTEYETSPIDQAGKYKDHGFNATDRSGETITIDEKYVQDNLGNLVKDTDLSKFIL